MQTKAMSGLRVGHWASTATILPLIIRLMCLGTLVADYITGERYCRVCHTNPLTIDQSRYGIAHEQFVWDLKSEPGLVEKFEQLYGTKELLVSYGKPSLSLFPILFIVVF